MSTETACDRRGNPLSEGSYVTAWRDGERYYAEVKEIKPHHPGDGDFRRLIVIRDDDHAEVQSYSDAVVIIPAEPCILSDDEMAAIDGAPDEDQLDRTRQLPDQD